MIMSFRLQMGILSCDEITFPKEPNVGFVIVKIIGFTSLIIIGFDPHVAKVGDLGIGIMHFGFFMKVAIWIKTRVGSNGSLRQWTIIQIQETKFFYTILWPFGDR